MAPAGAATANAGRLAAGAVRSLLTPTGDPVVRRMTEDEFIEATTSSFLGCIRWRSGDPRTLERLQARLRDFERAEGAVEKVAALQALRQAVFGTNAPRGSKLHQALQTISNDSQALLDQMQTDPEYRAHEAARQQREADAAEQRERQLLGTRYGEASVDQRRSRLDSYRERSGPGAALLGGIEPEMSEEAVLRRLTANFFERSDFTYTFNSSPTFKGSGDCRTLRNEFILVARDGLGIELERGDVDVPMFVRGGGRIIDSNGLTGNVDGGAHWLFENHHWAVWNGTPVDVLYGLFGEQKASISGTALTSGEYEGYAFADEVTVYVRRERSAGNSYTLDPSLAMSR